MSKPNKIILGLIGAAAVGIVIGILMYPEKGGAIRKQIADKANDIASGIGELLTSGKERLKEAGDTIAKEVNV